MIRLVLPYPPSTNRIWTVAKGTRRARVIKSKAARDYPAAVAMAVGIVSRGRVAFGSGDVGVRLDFFRPRATGDLDNLIKSVLDALQARRIRVNGHVVKRPGIAFTDDSQVRSLKATLHDDPANPRVEVQVWELSGGVRPDGELRARPVRIGELVTTPNVVRRTRWRSIF